ncbi:cytoplasmic tRNA 2-thiolation protein 2-A-like isoform X1 [Mytilus trossulus]|uniref:cytoplasmic tRNA 2-thiolation protein 2-A-like isoform X1 n=1 Tax=Mytilus trossulus TaxID=6551 RepID=UPI003003AB39
MCSIQEGAIENPIKTDKTEKSKVCMKCGGKAVLITRINDPLCRDCFMVYTTHKFRAAIGKSKIIRDGETVLVGFSGGQASSCLLQLIKDGLSERAHKKLRFKPSLLFIDEGAAIDMSAEERLDSCQKILQVMAKSGYPCHIRSLEEAMDSSFITTDSSKDSLASTELPDLDDKSQGQRSNKDLDTDRPKPAEKPKTNGLPIDKDFKEKCIHYDESEIKLKELLKSLKSVTAKEDLIKSLRYNILIDTARKHSHTKVMTGDCSTRLSVRLLSDISQGKGAHVAMETGFADKRLDDITVVRPIRDFSSKEVTLHNVLNDVESVFIPTLTTKAPQNTSIEHLTESFITGLQADYGSTVMNIMRTGEKLNTEILDSTEQQCIICHAPLDTSTGIASALNAVEFSQKISRKNDDKSSPECCGEGDGSCNTKSGRLNKEEALSTLCYGCRLMVKDLSDVNKLPEYIQRDITNRVNRSKMKADIQDYLLADD